MNFCPACGSRAVPKDRLNENENSKYVCTRQICGKEFKPRK